MKGVNTNSVQEGGWGIRTDRLTKTSRVELKTERWCRKPRTKQCLVESDFRKIYWIERDIESKIQPVSQCIKKNTLHHL